MLLLILYDESHGHKISKLKVLHFCSNFNIFNLLDIFRNFSNWGLSTDILLYGALSAQNRILIHPVTMKSNLILTLSPVHTFT